MRKKGKWKETGFKYKMKAGILEMISKGDTDPKKCNRKEFEYLIRQETVRERRICENYLKQQFIIEIPK
jgi:hypothetical protein